MIFDNIFSYDFKYMYQWFHIIFYQRLLYQRFSFQQLLYQRFCTNDFQQTSGFVSTSSFSTIIVSDVSMIST